jgi:hypothetical protein
MQHEHLKPDGQLPSACADKLRRKFTLPQRETIKTDKYSVECGMQWHARIESTGHYTA